jgi:hypothetical protein
VLVETAQPPAVAQISVTPVLLEKLMVLFQLYDPVANVIVAPSDAELIAFCTSEAELPALQLHDVPEPLQAAVASEGKKKRTTATKAKSAGENFGLIILLILVRSSVRKPSACL